jgi:hypothetical protein
LHLAAFVEVLLRGAGAGDQPVLSQQRPAGPQDL